jgi:hypothetical protein
MLFPYYYVLLLIVNIYLVIEIFPSYLVNYEMGINAQDL